MPFAKLEEYIMNNKDKVIAIDGPSGAGKSSLSKYLKEKYSCTVFHTDDYFLPSVRKTKERLNEPGGNLDYERLEEEIFKHLDQEKIQSNKYNCQLEVLEERRPKTKRSIVIVEGVYSLHPNFRKYYDFTVFLDVERELQEKRILKRSGEKMLERFRNEWIPLEDKYFLEFDLRNNVDLRIKIN